MYWEESTLLGIYRQMLCHVLGRVYVAWHLYTDVMSCTGKSLRCLAFIDGCYVMYWEESTLLSIYRRMLRHVLGRVYVAWHL